MIFCEDCRRLAIHTGDAGVDMVRAITRFGELARLGATVSRGDRLVLPLAAAAKAAPPGEDRDHLLAFLFGSRTHIAADRQFKTVYRLEGYEVFLTDAVDGPTDLSIAQDAFMLAEVRRTDADLFPPDLLDPDVPGIDDLGALVSDRHAIELQRLGDTGATGGAEPSFAAFSDREKPYVELDRYRAAARAGVEAVKAEVAEARLYDPDDDLGRLVRSLRTDGEAPSVDFAEALQAAGGQSHYARALRRAVGYWRALRDYLDGSMEAETFAAASDVTIPHVTRQVYGGLDDPAARARLLAAWHQRGGA